MWLGCFGVSLISWDAHSGSLGTFWMGQQAGCHCAQAGHPSPPLKSSSSLASPSNVQMGRGLACPLISSLCPSGSQNLCKPWGFLSSSLAILPTLDPLEVAGDLLRV